MFREKSKDLKSTRVLGSVKNTLFDLKTMIVSNSPNPTGILATSLPNLLQNLQKKSVLIIFPTSTKHFLHV